MDIVKEIETKLMILENHKERAHRAYHEANGAISVLRDLKLDFEKKDDAELEKKE